ncbi:uncharacterized protein LOC101845186, partial [Aplysia californica]|uniref:Uncharacterized protein LOC101845186 n=1 Tax=Aplysia californica TaxID=6500 RepID=A0ABM1A6H5_APLCA
MSRTKSLLEPTARSKEKIKRSHSTGPYLVRQETQFDETCMAPPPDTPPGEFSSDHRVTINDFDHIYPNVIVHAPHDHDFHGGDAASKVMKSSELRHHQRLQPRQFVDASGARIIEVNMDGDSEGTDITALRVASVDAASLTHVRLDEGLDESPTHLPSFSRSGTNSSPSHDPSNRQSQTNDIEYAFDHHKMEDGSAYYSLDRGSQRALREKEKLILYEEVLHHWKERARQRYKMARLASQQVEFPSSRGKERYNRRHPSRSTPCEYHRHDTYLHPLRRTKTVDEDPVYFSDVNRRRERFSGKPGRMFSSYEELNHHHSHSRCVHGRRRESPFSSCECPACALCTSGSITSEISCMSKRSSHDRSDRYKSGKEKVDRERLDKDRSERDRIERERSSKRRQKREAQKQRATPASSDIIKGTNRPRQEASNRNRRKRVRHSSSKSSRSFTLTLGSSTDSDMLRRTSMATPLPHTLKYSLDSAPLGNSNNRTAPLEVTPTPLVVRPRSPPQIHVTQVTSPEVTEKDVFQQVFTQEVELDDFSPVEEDEDPNLLLQRRLSPRETFLISVDIPDLQTSNTDPVPSPVHNLALTDSSINRNQLVQDNAFGAERVSPRALSSPASPSRARRNSVVTVTSGDLSMKRSKRPSRESQLTKHKSTSSSTPGTPSTCNVIMYDSNHSLDKHTSSSIVKAHAFLTRKHSSLDLAETLRPFHATAPSPLALRNASSMTSLCESGAGDNSGTLASSGYFTGKSLSNFSHNSADNFTDTYHQPARLNEENDLVSNTNLRYCDSASGPDVPVKSEHSTSVRPSAIGVQHDSCENKTLQSGNNPHTGAPSPSLPSPDTEPPRYHKDSESSNPPTQTIQHLSVTDTDSAMSSAPSPMSTPTTSRTVFSSEKGGVETKVKDSAYQTKQSSMEAEFFSDARFRRPVPPIREEDRKVTQRLHQAAVKLLVMQQRFRRARQKLSRDSAVHTISEDDPALDDIIVTSPKSRTFKPGVL